MFILACSSEERPQKMTNGTYGTYISRSLGKNPDRQTAISAAQTAISGDSTHRPSIRWVVRDPEGWLVAVQKINQPQEKILVWVTMEGDVFVPRIRSDFGTPDSSTTTLDSTHVGPLALRIAQSFMLDTYVGRINRTPYGTFVNMLPKNPETVDGGMLVWISSPGEIAILSVGG